MEKNFKKNSILLSDVLVFPFGAEVPPGLQGYQFIQQQDRAFPESCCYVTLRKLSLIEQAGDYIKGDANGSCWELGQPHYSLLRLRSSLVLMTVWNLLSPSTGPPSNSYASAASILKFGKRKKNKRQISLVPCNYCRTALSLTGSLMNLPVCVHWSWPLL